MITMARGELTKAKMKTYIKDAGLFAAMTVLVGIGIVALIPFPLSIVILFLLYFGVVVVLSVFAQWFVNTKFEKGIPSNVRLGLRGREGRDRRAITASIGFLVIENIISVIITIVVYNAFAPTLGPITAGSLAAIILIIGLAVPLALVIRKF